MIIWLCTLAVSWLFNRITEVNQHYSVVGGAGAAIVRKKEKETRWQGLGMSQCQCATDSVEGREATPATRAKEYSENSRGNAFSLSLSLSLSLSVVTLFPR